MNAEIITIGDELLIGQVVDTNSAYLAAELNKLGVSVIQITSIPDSREPILKALDDAAIRADLIIATGGLGPTNDDITKSTIAAYFGSKLVVIPSVIEKIRSLLQSRGMAMNERSSGMAELPDNCELLNNSTGSAQGMWFVKDGKNFIFLPGVPFEMKSIFREEMESRFVQRFNLPPIEHITILTHGVPESVMADMISEWEKQLPANLKLAYLPSPGILKLRITGKIVDDSTALRQVMNEKVEMLKALIGEYIYGYNDEKLEVIISNLLTSNMLSLSLAESCTGGLISFMLTSIPGSSAYYKGGIVAYSNEIKTSQLNVSPYTLIVNGAVSQAVVEQMADGARARFNSDYAVAVSGIAGPSGGTDEKPVGTTWIAIASQKRIVSHAYNFGEDRGRNMQKAAIAALFMLRKEIMDCL